jgi:hypothetical protein
MSSMGPMGTNPIPIDDLPGDVRKNVITQCESQACRDAKDALIILRNKIAALCSQVAAHKSLRDLYASIGGGLLAAAGAVAVGAAVSPWPFNLVLWIIVSVLGTAAAVMFALAGHEQNLMNILNSAITDRQNDFQQGVQTMLNACPEQCRGDSTLPTCP